MKLKVDYIKSVVSKLAEKYDIGRVILFGLYANGEAMGESIVSLAVDACEVVFDKNFTKDLRDELEEDVEVFFLSEYNSNSELRRNLDKGTIELYRKN